MKLQTRILIAAGGFRYGGTAALMLLGLIHPVHYFLGTLWLIGCRRILHGVLLPPLFPRAICANCHQIIELRSRWKCKDHYTDHRVRHVLAFHCNHGHELSTFECPTPDCRATIQLQKGNKKLFRRGEVVDSPLSPPRRQKISTGMFTSVDGPQGIDYPEGESGSEGRIAEGMGRVASPMNAVRSTSRIGRAHESCHITYRIHRA